ncbi:MAG TPA: bifunctional shikimate kinase/3-dehydroquinate synthase [Acidimicrobiales bacterium]|nr:bifunctional shikimate kinase/3-dehydroquinate synthase [Acidimicrobiales bacterium]
MLVGMMGAGKSTVGRALARRRGWDFFDSDARIEERTGRTVGEIWADQGEPVFRRLESEVLAEALSAERPAVVAAAGGVVLDPGNRARLRECEAVVWLRARPETLVPRVATSSHRPLLDSDPAGVLARLAAERAPLYAEVADVTVDVDGLPAEQVVALVEEALGGGALRTVTVDLGPRSYPVLVGPGARHRLLEVLPVGARRAAVVTQDGIGVTVDAGVEQRQFVMGEGEEAKCLETVEELCRGFTRFGLTRADVVVAVGGGVVLDTVGLAAALYHRGVAVIHVATTLLAQVDAAIGGKTGVNLPEGKNLVGAFWQPAGVLCDTEVLATLPPAEYRSGLGEMAKYHFLGEMERFADMGLAEKVARCVEIKARFVQADEREELGLSGGTRGAEPPGGARRSRASLNYGHTLAHALETAGHYDLRHGEAVAIGLVFAARLARRLGRIDDERVSEHVQVVTGYGLPTAVPVGADPGELVELMARDKKAVDGLTFVLDGPGGVEVVPGVDRAEVEATLAEMQVPR